MYNFKAVENGKRVVGKVVYSKEENSFDFLLSRNTDIILLIGYLNLGIDSETMKAQQVWGFSPFESWGTNILRVPPYVTGELLLEGEIQPGTSWRIEGSEKWDTSFDSSSGWFCIGNSLYSETDTAIEFANDTIAVISNNHLKAIWMKPQWVE